MATAIKNKVFVFDTNESIKFTTRIEAPTAEEAVIKFKNLFDIEVFTYEEENKKEIIETGGD